MHMDLSPPLFPPPFSASFFPFVIVYFLFHYFLGIDFDMTNNQMIKEELCKYFKVK